MKYDNDRLGAALKMYLGTKPLPMHMPGHKRNTDVISDIFSRDITEISGFDNLHSPSGLLKDLEDAAAALWHKEHAYCSVGGATSMILAAVCASAICNPGSEVLVAMNCHLSVWNALAIAGSNVVPLMPAFDPQFPFSGPVLLFWSTARNNCYLPHRLKRRFSDETIPETAGRVPACGAAASPDSPAHSGC